MASADILAKVDTPATTNPLGNVGAETPSLPVILSALSLPPPPASVPLLVPVVPIPRISGTRSSPSAIIKSAVPLTCISAYCVYATFAVDGTSTVEVLSISKT